ncbi:interferon-like [Aythya fuligula]|uniref:Interferon-like n=1 Tax=Aythya fuligula TaxID=219594 RepID=A0A6J3EF22_AYTFU|nr:interferon-like [Aythya fuligula]
MPGPSAPPPPAIYSALLALLLLLTPPANAFSCGPLRLHDSTFTWDSLQLLRKMAPSPTEPCLHQHAFFPFPDILLDTDNTEQAAHTALHLLKHLFNILSSPSIPVHWLHTASHDLLNQLNHYIYHLERCIPADAMRLHRRGPRNLHLSINKYFRSIQHFLQSHNYSPCAWDHVRLEARACFQRLDTLIRRMKSQASPSLFRSHLHLMTVPSQRQWSKRHQLQHRRGRLSTAQPSSSHKPMVSGKQP